MIRSRRTITAAAVLLLLWTSFMAGALIRTPEDQATRAAWEKVRTP